MYLSDLRDLIANKLDYDPTGSSRYEVEVRRLLNEAQHHLHSVAPWPWAQREFRVVAYADIVATDATVTASSPTVTTAASFFPLDLFARGDAHLIGPDGADYQIVGRASSTQVTLDRDYEGTTVAGTAQIRVAWRTIRLPEDALSVMQVGVRPLVDSPTQENRRFTPLTRREDEQDGLYLDLTGGVEAWVPADDEIVRPPVRALSVTAGGGAWPAGTYEFSWALTYRGCRSSLAPVTTWISTGVSTPTVNLPVYDDRYSKEIYVRAVSVASIATLVAPRGPITTMLGSTAAVNVAALIPDDTSHLKPRAPEHGGRTRQIRLYPRPATDVEVAIRILVRAPLMLEEQDEPMCPSEHHGYIASYALRDLYLKHDQMPHSRLEEQRCEQILRQMRARYLTPEARSLSKGDAFASRDAGLRGPLRDRTLTWRG